jgi:hypothetical protein
MLKAEFRKTLSTWVVMLSPEELAKIRPGSERLEKAHDESTDSGIRKLIEAGIEEQKQKLASGHGRTYLDGDESQNAARIAREATGRD